MPAIILENSLISYYGNPAGYIEKEKAVVDSIFKNDELTDWCKSHKLSPQWTDGVMERLIKGGITGKNEITTFLKNVRIWQLKPDVDIYKKFVSLEEFKKTFGKPQSEDYRIAYDGYLGTNNLESIYQLCNTDIPHGYEGHSLSMSDVIELYDQNTSQFHYCDRFGFCQIDFEPNSQIKDMEITMQNSF